jgi:hypothetical protein
MYYKVGSESEIPSLKDTPLYAEDWIGLRALDEAKKVDWVATPGTIYIYSIYMHFVN